MHDLWDQLGIGAVGLQLVDLDGDILSAYVAVVVLGGLLPISRGRPLEHQNLYVCGDRSSR
jgi:hypothetical protein